MATSLRVLLWMVVVFVPGGALLLPMALRPVARRDGSDFQGVPPESIISR